MSDSIENRIINLQFNNKDFEKHASESMKTLDKFEKSLNGFKGTKVGLEEIVSGFKKFGSTLSQVGNGAKTALSNIVAFGRSTKESADVAIQSLSSLEQIGVGALRRLGEQALNAGENLVKSLTIDQVTAGWEKFGEKTRSVASIMSATGMSADEVAGKLKKLNWYTDETSYAYTDMTNNIGKFTNAGIALDDAITAMIGIGNAAGLAGSSVQDASHAMEGFSGAMAQGYMDRQRWSWIKTAHMDTVQFKQALIDAAESMGILENAGDGVYGAFGYFDDDSIVTIENFENAMTKSKWLTRDVMVKALKEFGGTTEEIFDYWDKNGGYTSDIIDKLGISAEDLGLRAFKASQEARTFSDAIDSVKDAVSTGLMTAFEHLIGNYDEAKELWTDLANTLWDVFAEPIGQLNEELEKWSNQGGHKLFRSSLYNFMETTATYIEMFKSGIREVFGELDSDRLMRFTERLYELSESFANTVENGVLGDVANVWKSFLSIFDAISSGLDTVKSAFDEAFNSEPVQAIIEDVEEVSEAVNDVREDVENAFKAIEDIWTKGNAGLFGSGQDRIDNLIAAGLDPAKVQSYINKLVGNEYATLDELHEAMLKDSGSFAKSAVDDVEEVSEAVEDAEEEVTTFGKAVGSLRNVFTNIASNIRKIFEYANDDNQLVRIFRGVYSAISLVKYVIDDLNRTMLANTVLGRITHMVVNPIATLADKITEFANGPDVGKLGQIISQVKDAFQSVVSIVALIGSSFAEALSEMFGSSKPVDLLLRIVTKLSKILKNIYGYLKENNRLTKIFKGVISLVKILLKLAKNVAKVLEPIIGTVLEVAVDLLSRIGDELSYIANDNGLDKVGEVFKTVFGSVFSMTLKAYKIATTVYDFLKGAFVWVWNFIGALVSRLKLADGFTNLGTSIKNFAKAVSDILGTLFGKKNEAQETTRSIVMTGEDAEDAFSWLDGVVGLLDVVSGGMSALLTVITDVINGVNNFISAVKGDGSTVTRGMPGEKQTVFDKLSYGLGHLFDNVDGENVTRGAKAYSGSVLTGVGQAITDFFKNTKIDWDKLKKIGGFIGLIITIIEINKTLTSADTLLKNLGRIPLSIGDIFKNFSDIFKNISGTVGQVKTSIKKLTDIQVLSSYVLDMIGLALAVGLLGSLPEDVLARGIVYMSLIGAMVAAIAKVAGQFQAAQKSITKINNSGNKTFNLLSGNTNTINAGPVGFALVILSIGAFALAIANAIEKIAPYTDKAHRKVLIWTLSILGGFLGAMTLILLAIGAIAKMAISEKTIATEWGTSTSRGPSGVFFSIALVIGALTGALLALTGAIATMSKIPADQLSSAGDAMMKIALIFAGLMLSVVLIMKILYKKDDDMKIDKPEKTLLYMAGVLSLMVGALDALIPMILVLSGIALNPEALSLSILSIAGLMGVLVLVAVAMAELSRQYANRMDVSAIMTIATSLVIFAAAIEVLLPALLVLSIMEGFNPGSSVVTAFSLVLIIGAMVKAMQALGKVGQTASASRMFAASTALLVFSAAIGVLGGVVALMSWLISKYTWQTVLAAAGIMSLLMVVLGGVLVGIAALINHMTEVPDDTISTIGKVMISLAASVLIIAAAIALLLKVGSTDEIAAVATTLGIFVLGLTAIVAVLAYLAQYTAITPALQAIGLIFLSIGAIIIGFALSLIAFGVAVKLVSSALPGINENLPRTTEVLVDFLSKISPHIGELIGLSIAFTLFVGTITVALAVGFGLIMTICNNLQGQLPSVSKKTMASVAALVIGIGAGVAAATPETLKTIEGVIIKVLAFLGELAPVIAEGLYVMVLNIIEGLADAIGNNAGELIYAIDKVVVALLKLLTKAVYQLVKAGGGIEKTLLTLFLSPFGFDENAINTILGFLPSMSMVSNAMEAGMSELDGFYDGMLDNAYSALNVGAERAAREDRASLSNITSGFGVFGQNAGQAAGGNVVDGLTNGLKDVISDDNIKNALGGVLGDLDIGGSIDPSQFLSAFQNEDGSFKMDDLRNSMNFLGDSGIDTSNILSTAMSDYGLDISTMSADTAFNTDAMGDDWIQFGYGQEDVLNNAGIAMGDYVDAVATNSADAQTELDQGIDGSLSIVKGYQPSFYQAGVLLVERLQDGMDYQFNFANGSLVSHFNQMLRNAGLAWQIESPSKKFYAIGSYGMQGLANGIEETGKMPIDRFNDVVTSINRLAYLDDYQPTITPVLDLTNVRNGAQAVDSLFKMPTKSVELSRSADQLNRQWADFNQNSTYTDDNVIGAINELGSKFDSMNDNMMNTNIYLDTGALVGATVGPMDGALGRRAQRTKRGG